MAGEWDVVGEGPANDGWDVADEWSPAGAAPAQRVVDPDAEIAAYQKRTSFAERLLNDLKFGFKSRERNQLARMASTDDPVGFLDALAAAPGIAAGAPVAFLPDQAATAAKLKPSAQAGLAQNMADMLAMPQRPVVQQIGQAKSFGEGVRAFSRDPLGAVAGFGVQSLPLQLESLAAAPVMGPLGPLAIGAQSADNELNLGIAEYVTQDMQKRGLDPRDPDAMIAAMSDPQLMAAAKAYAAKRAAIIGPLDAATGGLARVGLVPSKLLPNPVAREAANALVAQPVAQAAAGAGGEAAAQLASTGSVGSPGEVLAEAMGEFFTAPVEVASVGGKPALDRIAEARADAKFRERSAKVAPVAAARALDPSNAQWEVVSNAAEPPGAGAVPPAATPPAPAAPAAPAQTAPEAPAAAPAPRPTLTVGNVPQPGSGPLQTPTPTLFTPPAGPSGRGGTTTPDSPPGAAEPPVMTAGGTPSTPGAPVPPVAPPAPAPVAPATPPAPGQEVASESGPDVPPADAGAPRVDGGKARCAETPPNCQSNSHEERGLDHVARPTASVHRGNGRRRDRDAVGAIAMGERQ